MKRFSLLSICAVLLFLSLTGCASMIHVATIPDHPALPEVPTAPISPLSPTSSMAGGGLYYTEKHPDFLKDFGPDPVKFIPKPGTDSKKTIDNVTVQVMSILDVAQAEDAMYMTKIEGPNRVFYDVSHFPRIVAIRVANGTDHIVTLGQTAMLTGTIIRLEDENGRKFPLISDQMEARRSLIKRVNNAFTDYIEKIRIRSADLDDTASWTEVTGTWESECDAAYAEFEGMIHEEYAPQYELFAADLKRHRGMVATQDMAKGNYLTEYGIKKALEDNHPDKILADAKQEFQMAKYAERNKLTTKRNEREIKKREILAKNGQRIERIEALRRKAQDKIEAIPLVPNVVTEGEYPPIRVMPGRSEDILIPFTKRKGEIKEMNIHIIDLPTKVDAAGITTKRASFTFQTVPVAID